MTFPTTKVDMAQRFIAIDEVLVLPPITQVELTKRRAQHDAERPAPAKSAKTSPKNTAR